MFYCNAEGPKEQPNIRATSLLPELRAGDWGAIFTSLCQEDILLIGNEKPSIDQECKEIRNPVRDI